MAQNKFVHIFPSFEIAKNVRTMAMQYIVESPG